MCWVKREGFWNRIKGENLAQGSLRAPERGTAWTSWADLRTYLDRGKIKDRLYFNIDTKQSLHLCPYKGYVCRREGLHDSRLASSLLRDKGT